MYPVSYEADYQGEGRNRLTTFFRYFVAIPWLIVASIYVFVAQILVVIVWFAMVFTGRYPEALYNFNSGAVRALARVNSFQYLLTDEWPPFGLNDDPSYPIRVGIPPPLDQYSRAKAFFRLILAIPVYLLSIVQALILYVCALISWFAILFTGRHPEGLFTPMRSAMAYLTRAGAYYLLITEDWPPFSLEEPTAPAGSIERESAPTG